VVGGSENRKGVLGCRPSKKSLTSAALSLTTHKGSVEDAAKAAGRSAVVNTATGVIPLGVIMPVQEAAPGMMGLVAAKLPQVSLFCAVLAPSSSSAEASAWLRCVLEARDAYEGETATPWTSGRRYRPPWNATPDSPRRTKRPNLRIPTWGEIFPVGSEN